MGSSPGEVWPKRESALMPLSLGHAFATNPLRYPWVACGLPGGDKPCIILLLLLLFPLFQMLMRGQKYQVFLDLEMPYSVVNEKLGRNNVTLLEEASVM